MANGDISVIIAICVVVPALVMITVCGVLFYSHRNKDRKFHRQRSERIPPNNYIIDFSNINRQHRSREPPPVLEQSPPAYANPMNQTRRQQLPLFSPIRTTPYVLQTSTGITPSIYSSMPPSYDEIFLTPHTVTNR